MDPTYEARLINDVFISNNQYEFDIYAKQTGTIPFKVHSLQCALTFDDSIRNGGNLSVIYIPNTSAMDSSQIPNELDISTLVSGRRVIKIAGRIPFQNLKAVLCYLRQEIMVPILEVFKNFNKFGNI